MHRTFLIRFLTAIWLGLGLMAAQTASAVTVAQLQKDLAQGAKLTVIDVRSTALFSAGHIPGAINIPASICAKKVLPPLGRVVVYDAGLGRDRDDLAARALSTKPGISVDMLDGGFAAWESAQALTTRRPGMKKEVPNYISYQQLKAAKTDGLVLVDLRQSHANRPKTAGDAVPSAEALTDLTREFPGVPVTTSVSPTGPASKAVAGGSSPPTLWVLIDNGDGRAEALARTYKANGMKRYVILAGGELILSRHGQTGLGRAGTDARLSQARLAPGATTY